MKNLNLPKGRARKLQPNYIGPYVVTEVWPNTSNYRVELPPELNKCGIKNQFHISRLKLHVPNDDEKFPRQEACGFYDFGDDPESEWQVDSIVDHHWK
jgi:hypothetical protein